MTLIANLFVCALVLTALAAFWILVSVWLDRDKLGSPKLVRGDDPRADTEQDPVVIDSDRVKWYPQWICPDDPSSNDTDRCEYILAWLEVSRSAKQKCTQCQGDPDGCMNCR